MDIYLNIQTMRRKRVKVDEQNSLLQSLFLLLIFEERLFYVIGWMRKFISCFRRWFLFQKVETLVRVSVLIENTTYDFAYLIFRYVLPAISLFRSMIVISNTRVYESWKYWIRRNVVCSWVSIMDNEEDLFEVVISGISGKYPLSEDIEELKENLLAKKLLVTEDDCRWNTGKNFRIIT